METTPNKQERNFNTISPSAKALLLLKGMTDIPYARQVAALISGPGSYEPDMNSHNFSMWSRTIHFEVRYKSIDQLLKGLNINNILELSSGFSFRGLAAASQKPVHYIDTDLPDLIATKRGFNEQLQSNLPLKGSLEVLPLNALDEQAFKEVVSHFPAGELTIVNEGLLMYLGAEEKKKLCAIIRDVLTERGGYWITADIYMKRQQEMPAPAKDDKLQKFFEEHHIQDNMFNSFEEAEAFFKEQGFVIDADAEMAYAASALLPNMLASATEEQLAMLGKGGRIHATWRLRLADKS